MKASDVRHREYSYFPTETICPPLPQRLRAVFTTSPMKNKKQRILPAAVSLALVAWSPTVHAQQPFASLDNAAVSPQGAVREQIGNPDATEITLPAIEVVGRGESGAYHAHEASGTKSDLPLRELPQAVRVMSRQTLDDLGAVRVDDVLDYVGGVSRQNNFGGLWDNMAIRGLAGDINNGMPLLRNGFSANRGFNAPRDTANIERIEFLKGPAAALYGASEPGGTLNVVTKKPSRKVANALELYVGSDEFYRTALDSTGPLSESIAYRLNVALEDRGSFRDFVDTRRTLFAPALTWRLSPSTVLDYNGELLRHRTPLDRGVVAVNGQLGVIPRDRFLGEPADGDVQVENQTHQFVLEHMVSPDWSARMGLSYKRGAVEGFSTEPISVQGDGRTLLRQRRHRDYASEDLALQGELIGRFQLGQIGHELVVGAETYRMDFDQRMLRINAGASYAI
ncbi:MAG TPA: TonB-dependent receptor plug domain-containing protein, partial [Noviherbaspirillum sp.]